MNLAIETEQETDGRWLAEITQISGVLVYGVTRDEAIARVEALALRVLVEDDRRWDESFAKSQDKLVVLSAKVDEDIRAGRIADIGIDELAGKM